MKEKKGQEEGCRFTGGAGNGHGQGSKIFGNGGRTRTTKKSHGGKQHYNCNFAHDSPSAFFDRFVEFVVGARLEQPLKTRKKVTFGHGRSCNGHQGNGIDTKDKLKQHQIHRHTIQIKSKSTTNEYGIPSSSQNICVFQDTYFILADSKLRHDGF